MLLRPAFAIALVLLSQQSSGLTVLLAVEQVLAQIGQTARVPVTAQIRGRIFDEFGASIPDASVTFEPLDQRSGLTAFGAVADSRGRFDFAAIRPGAYRVTCKALGYATTVVTEEVVAGKENEVTVVVRRRSVSSAATAPVWSRGSPRRTAPGTGRSFP